MLEHRSDQRRSWLCIAYAFPPVNRSGTHRTLAFVRHLHRAGWDATVLTVHPRDEPTDDSLFSELPDSTSIIRTRWFRPVERLASLRRFFPARSGVTLRESYPKTSPNGQSAIGNWQSTTDWFSRLLQLPDSRIGWVPPAVWAGLRTIRRRRPHVIYSTSPYASAHLIALTLNRLTHIPWVADFRDPWCANPFRDLPYPSLRRWDARLERLVVRHASHIVCNTPNMAEDFTRRYPYATSRCTTILNGIDAERFSTSPLPKGRPPGGTVIEPRRVGRWGEFVMLHSGQFYGPRSPKALFAALRRLAADTEKSCAAGRSGSQNPGTRFRLVLLGPELCDDRRLCDLASEAGIVDYVDIRGPKCHSEALSCMAGADALVLVGGAGPGGDLQVPNKLFEYLALRRPILALLAPDSPARSVLREACADAIVCGPLDETGIARAMQELADPSRKPRPDAWSGVERFDRSHRAEELLAVFENVLQPRRIAADSGVYNPCKMNGFVARSRPIVVSGP
ncbi:MAG: glycosyltransferase [Phycisphaerales bacterium]|nr:glycosyltransferase [Phycisphaerales bacterium]